MTPLAPARVGWCPGALRPMATGDGLLVRLKPRGGVLSLAQAAAIARLAMRHGNGALDLTARANLQIRGVTEDRFEPLLRDIEALGLLDPNPEAEAVRNIVASPLAGLDRSASVDAARIAADLDARLLRDTDLWRLPAKWSFVIDDSGPFSLRDIAADIRCEALPDGPIAVSLAGDPTYAACRPTEAVGLVVALCRLALDTRSVWGEDMTLSLDQSGDPGRRRFSPSPLAGEGAPQGRMRGGVRRGEMVSTPHPSRALRRDPSSPARGEGDKPDAPVAQSVRMGELVRRWGAADLFSAAGIQPAGRLPPRPTTVAQDLVGRLAHVGERTFGVAPPFGSLHARDLLALAELAAPWGARDLRLTPWRVVLVTGLPEAGAAALPDALPTDPWITRPDDPRLAVAACAGQPACPRGSTPVPVDAAVVAGAVRSLAGYRGIAVHVSGCAKGCAHPHPASVTLVGRDGRYDLVLDGKAGDKPVAVGLTLAAALRRIGADPR